MAEGLIKCWICDGVATAVCDYCGQPICRDTDSCRKLIEGLDPGWACTACYAIIMSRGLVVRFGGIGPAEDPRD